MCRSTDRYETFTSPKQGSVAFAATQFVGVDVLKDSDINVDTANHIVTLKGRVLTAAGRAKAVDIAKKTDGVTKVIDQLTIGPKR